MRREKEGQGALPRLRLCNSVQRVHSQVPRESLSRPKFVYEDLTSPGSDMSSVRPRHYFDALLGKNAGVKYKLPYYQAYYDRANKAGFGIQQGMCARQLQARREELYRDESGHLAGLKRVASFRGRIAPHSVLKNSFEVSWQASPGRVLGPRVVRLRRSRNPSRLALDKSQKLMQELDTFDRKSRQPSISSPLEAFPSNCH